MALDPGDAARARAADGGERRRQVRLAAVSSVIGTSIEWYDLHFAHISWRLAFLGVAEGDESHERRRRRTPSGR
ncbi:hypothetical protein [Actinomadura nitritigenes]|uniref:hypothetical protein n=1 Tax=Actinomadura nitritigenes TaxID=134602 RepID=UPI003D91A53D